jgi:hypothetical protein
MGAKIKRGEAPVNERIVIKAIRLGQEGEARSGDKTPFSSRNTHLPTVPFPPPITTAGSSSISCQSASPHSDCRLVPQSSHTPDRHLLHSALLRSSRRFAYNLRSIEAMPLSPSKKLPCRSLPLKNVTASLQGSPFVGIANSTSSSKSDQKTSKFRSFSKPAKATECAGPKAACGHQKHLSIQGNIMGSKEAPSPENTPTIG